MNCCRGCFNDVEIKQIFFKITTKEENRIKQGKCDFCASEDVSLYELDTHSELAELLDGVLNVYTPISELPEDFPVEKGRLIKDILYEEWNIFNLEPDSIQNLLVNACSERYEAQPALFNTPVGIRQSINKDYMKENSIFKDKNWSHFAEGIKTQSRFHGDYVNTEQLLTFLRCIVKIYPKEKRMYRSRICDSKEGYGTENMGAPPYSIARGGRVNPDGISILYLSNEEETTLHEIRAGRYDYVTVGEFELLKDTEIINLTDIDRISPFIGSTSGFDFTQYAINIEHLKRIAKEIAKPLRKDSTLEYLPTQYISDYIRSKGYAGIEYQSTMCEEGINLAIFEPDLFVCKQTRVYAVESISYRYKEVN